MSEEYYIKVVHSKLTSGSSISSLIPEIEEKFPSSVILVYYIGYYYEIIEKDLVKSRVYYKKCMSINPLFTPPVFNLGVYFINSDQIEEAYTVFNVIFCKETIDATVSGTLKFNLPDNIKILEFMLPCLLKAKRIKHAQKMIDTIQPHLDLGLGGGADLCELYFLIGGLYSEIDSKKSLKYLGLALELNPKNALLEKITTSVLVSNSYLDHSERLNIQSDIYDTDLTLYPTFIPPVTNRKIRLGYISPDFNKNAVGLYLTPLLKYFNTEKFQVYCYYNNKSSDQYTGVFKQLPNITFVNISDKTDEQVFSLIKYNHQIDILVDLISHGYGGRPRLISMAPAPYIINYIGFPESSKMKTVTHFITDMNIDPNQDLFTETLIKLPRIFSCWYLFDNEQVVPLPDRDRDRDRDHDRKCKKRIGIFNKMIKYHDDIIKVWGEIASSDPNIIFCFKLYSGETREQIYDKFQGIIPRSQLDFLPFCDTLDGYYSLFNDIDLCLDTSPYSGTTTTCSSLYMGVPVVTWKKNDTHVSNVTVGILKAMGTGYSHFIATTATEYKQIALDYLLGKSKRIARRTIRRDFFNLMDPLCFIKEYESALISIVS